MFLSFNKGAKSNSNWVAFSTYFKSRIKVLEWTVKGV